MCQQYNIFTCQTAFVFGVKFKQLSCQRRKQIVKAGIDIRKEVFNRLYLFQICTGLCFFQRLHKAIDLIFMRFNLFLKTRNGRKAFVKYQLCNAISFLCSKEERRAHLHIKLSSHIHVLFHLLAGFFCSLLFFLYLRRLNYFWRVRLQQP